MREYAVQVDRVRYYSVERGEWEEIPLDLVDIKKTEASIKEWESAETAQAKEADVEEAAERAIREEIERVPQELGVYMVAGKDLKPIKQAEAKVKDKKSRNILKIISPVPMVSGKSTIEIDGEQSANITAVDQPEFYIRLSAIERFGIAKLTPSKGVRIVDRIEVVPVSNEIVEKLEMVDVFRHQVGDEVYKIWPVKPLVPGEYAVVQYTEGKANVQVWDFAFRPTAK